MYTTRELLGAIEGKFKFDPLFLSLFFREVFTFDSEEILLDKIPGEVGMAVYCNPMVGGKVVKTRGASTNSFKPGYVKPKHQVNPNMTIKRLPGETLNGPLSPADRLNRIRAQNLSDEELAIAQLEELQAAASCLFGKYTVSGENVETYELDMGRRADNTVALTGADKWSAQLAAARDTYNPMDDIEATAEFAEGSIDLLIMDAKALGTFKQFKKVEDVLDTRRGSNSQLELALKDLGKVASWRGRIGDVDIVVYKGKYIHPKTGVKTNYMPDNCVCLANFANRGIRTYGAIQDIKAQQEGITEATRFPRNWEEGGDPAVEFTMTQSAPAMLVPNPDEFCTLWPEGLPV